MNNERRIAAVQPVVGRYALLIQWSDGKRNTVDLAEHIQTYSILKPLVDLELFRSVKVGEDGFDVNWESKVELSSATLHRLTLSFFAG
jgi:hypothetical protein